MFVNMCSRDIHWRTLFILNDGNVPGMCGLDLVLSRYLEAYLC
jgi:hypothetical protein